MCQKTVSMLTGNIVQMWIMDVDTVLYQSDSQGGHQGGHQGGGEGDSALETHVLSPLHVIKILYKDCLRTKNHKYVYIYNLCLLSCNHSNISNLLQINII